MVAPIYISINSVGGLPFLRILSSTFFFFFFLLCLLVFQLQTQLSTEFGDQAFAITILGSWFPIRFYQQGSL